MRVAQHTCGRQRPTGLPPSAIWVPGIRLKRPGLIARLLLADLFSFLSLILKEKLVKNSFNMQIPFSIMCN